MNDEELERLLREADPARTPLTAELSPDQLALRDRIMATPAPVATGRLRAHPSFFLLPMAAVMVLALVVVGVLALPGHRAEAALTPPPIPLTNSENMTLEEVVAMATEQLASEAGPATSRRTKTTGWYIQITELAEGERSVAISPQVTTTSWEPDGSGTVRMVAGTPFWADGSTAAIPESAAPPPGAELMSSVYAPGEMAVPPVEPAGDTPDAMLAVLRGLGMPEVHDAGDMLDFIGSAMQWWTFDNAQHSALIRLLFEQSNARVLGTGVDRAGREVVGITAESAAHPDIRTTLLISAQTGRIVGTESTRTAPDGDIPEGAVVAYTMWELG